MTFPILGGNGAVTGAYSIDNSLRFNSGDSARLSRTFASAGDRTAWTWSGWIKRGNLSNSASRKLFATHVGGSYLNMLELNVNGNGSHNFRYYDDISSIDKGFITSQTFRDIAGWYHITFVYDSGNATSTDRLQLYVNGERVTSFSTVYSYPTLNEVSRINSNIPHYIGSLQSAGYYDGYMAEMHFIDGTAKSPTDFGEFDEDSGIWKPIEYSGTYGTNGFYLDFENSGSLGADQSGNGNNFTPANLASTDQTTDTPTNNFATLNANLPDSGYNTSELSEGNLIYNVSEGNNGDGQPTGNMPVTSGKWYWEIKFTSAQNSRAIGLCRADKVSQGTVQLGGTGLSQTNATISLNLQDQQIIQKDENGSTTTEGSSLGGISNGDIFGHFLDLDNGTFQFYLNGSAYGSQFGLDNLSSWTTHGALPTATGKTYMRWDFNFGNPPFSISSGNSDANGYGNFEYSPNDGTYNYLALCTQNLATELSPTIDDGSEYFNTVLYTGTGSSQSITGVGFQPDLVYTTSRSNSYNNGMFDSSRGANKLLNTNTTNAEASIGNGISSFDSDGFSFSGDAYNTSAYTFVSWNWKANAGSTSSNTDGDETTTVQASTTSGFSIITYQPASTLSDQTTIGHGLGSSPDFLIYKNRDTSSHWIVYPMGISGQTDQAGFLSLADAFVDANILGQGYFDNPTSTTIRFRTGSSGSSSGGSTDKHLIYAFKSINGYSKFGSYTSNNSSDGTFIYLGFKPAFVMVKGNFVGNWVIADNKRETFNEAGKKILFPNLSNAETNYTNGIDMLSNGFKARGTGSTSVFNANSTSLQFIYMAFAESPFVSSTGIPVTAR